MTHGKYNREYFAKTTLSLAFSIRGGICKNWVRGGDDIVEISRLSELFKLKC
jgi:hypothetical protein